VSAPPSAVEDRSFWLLVLAASAAFAWILWPFFGAVLWGTVIAILFAPLQRRLVSTMRGRRSLAALLSLAIIVLLVILPLALVATLVLQEAVNLYQAVQAGEIAPGRYLQQILDALPSWLDPWLGRLGLGDLGAIQERISASVVKALQFVGPRALAIGQNTFDFVVDTFIMLYLLFFLLRDGDGLTARIREALPLQPALKRDLGTKFTTVIRATIKGGIVVAIVQGALGGLIFWLLGIHAPVLWGVLMAFLSLLPAVGAGLVWAPVAIWLAWRSGIDAESRPNLTLGIFLLLLAVAVRGASGLAAELFTMRGSMVMALAGLTVYQFGIRQLIRWWLPFALICLSIPLPELITQALALPLQRPA
jgi:predicted PurR-regulated permease PerM